MGSKGIERGVVCLLQGDIPPTPYPFRWMAEILGTTEEEVLKTVKELKCSGKLKRISALLKHRDSGFRYNAMVCARIEPEELIDRIALEVSKDTHVTHCYHRKPHPKWNFNLFFMYHEKDKDRAVEGIKNLLQGLEGVNDFRILFSTREFKKTSVRYVE